MKLAEIRREYHPWKHIIYALIFVGIALAVSLKFDLKNKELEAGFENYFEWENFQIAVFREPIKEEIAVRGPAWLVLVLLSSVSYFWRSLKLCLSAPLMSVWVANFRNKVSYFKITLLHILFWLPLLGANLAWSLDHIWPLVTFAMGIVFGATVFHTREIYYGVPGIFIASILHIIFSFFTFFGTLARIHLLQ